MKNILKKIIIYDSYEDKEALNIFLKYINNWINSAILISCPYKTFPDDYKFIFINNTKNQQVTIKLNSKYPET